MLRGLNPGDCSLDLDGRAARASRLRTLQGCASDRDGDRFRFPLDPALAAEIAEVAVLESRCCPVAFRLEITRSQMILEVRKEVDDGLLRL